MERSSSCASCTSGSVAGSTHVLSQAIRGRRRRYVAISSLEPK